MTLGWRIRLAMHHAGVSHQEMADELGVTQGTLRNWCGDRNEPRPIYLKQIAQRTGVPLGWLAGLEET
jgi:transcriptional regulator with XRE-family HTH domain